MQKIEARSALASGKSPSATAAIDSSDEEIAQQIVARVTHGYMDTLRILGTFSIRIPNTWYFWYTDTGYLVPMVSAKYPCLRIIGTYCSPVAY